MGGFDNGTLGSGVFAQAKQFGSILRGAGPPVPQAGVQGDLYLDVQSWFLYEKRSADSTDPWGHYLFQVPPAYQNTLKWFSPSIPTDDVGIIGDYCLVWAGFSNYGMQPSICGPKVINATNAGGWLENGNGPQTQLDPLYADYALATGLVDEGAASAFSTSTQMIAAGLLNDEYIISVPVTNTGGTPVNQYGLQSHPVNVTVTLNPLYTAHDSHGV